MALVFPVPPDLPIGGATFRLGRLATSGTARIREQRPHITGDNGCRYCSSIPGPTNRSVMPESAPSDPRARQGGGLGSLLQPYRGAVAGLVGLTLAGGALNLLIPRLVADAIDSYGQHT